MTDAETAAAICSWVNDNMKGVYNLRQVNARFLTLPPIIRQISSRFSGT